MRERYRIFGSELSPYSVKVRSYFRYKNIPHEWIIRSNANEDEFRQHAKLPLIPLVLTPDGHALQDSTPIIEQLETLFPDPPVHPSDPAAAFLSALIEEYADEWGNKPMFHYRWFYPPDQQSAGERIARSMMPGISDADLSAAVEMVKQRMTGRLAFVGSSAATKDQIEASYVRQLEILERHLSRRTYLFGARPVFADFGLYAQLYQCSTDPTPASIMRARSPHVVQWIQAMLGPRNEGELSRGNSSNRRSCRCSRTRLAARSSPGRMRTRARSPPGRRSFPSPSAAGRSARRHRSTTPNRSPPCGNAISG